MINLIIILCLILYGWAVVGIFLDNDYTAGRFDDDSVLLTECYICIEALIYILIMTPVIFAMFP